MILGFAVSAAVGLLCICFGLLIAGKQKLDLLQRYLCEHVRPEDAHAFSLLTGIGIMLFGAGILLSGVLLFSLRYSWAIWLMPFALGAVGGTGLILTAQRKFNRGDRSK